jgi:pimeloyl-ACP methyl ester carboxylesterase
MIEMDLVDDLGKITAPTLVMDGDLDFLTPLDQGPQGAGNRLIAERIPNAELYVIEGVAHTNLMEVPELSTKVVVEFLQRVASEAAAAR